MPTKLPPFDHFLASNYRVWRFLHSSWRHHAILFAKRAQRARLQLIADLLRSHLLARLLLRLDRRREHGLEHGRASHGYLVATCDLLGRLFLR